MANLTIGDLAQSFMLQRRGAHLKTEINRLTQELSTGRVADVKSVLAGNFSYLTDIERDLKALDGYKVSTTEAGQVAGTMQTSLERIQSSTGPLSNAMILISTSALETVVPQVANDARASLASIVGALNVDVGGRSMFAGTATNTAPLASDTDIMAGLSAAIAGETTAADIMTAAQTWFDDPAGFRAAMYQGSDTGLAPFSLADADRLSIDIKADDPVLKNLIMNTALGAIADDPALGIDAGTRRDLISQAGQNLLGAQDQLTGMRASVGFAESRIEEVGARNAAERTTLEFARSALLEADPYETASRLEEVQFQLQGLYSVTVRLSELSLLNFMR